MATRVLILQPRPKPVCGVTDHSRQLMAAWADMGIESTLVEPAEVEAMPAAQMAGAFILVQASIYGYQPKGLPFDLVRILRRAGAAGAVIQTYFHELWVPAASPTSSAYWISPAQRMICRWIAQCSSAAHFNTPWATAWGRSTMGAAARYSPTFSNVGELEVPRPLKERASALVCFGAPANRTQAYRALLPHLPSLAAAGLVEELVDIGADTSVLPSADLEAMGLRVRALGKASSEAVSAELASARYGLHYTPWSLATKSGIYGALIAHGVLPVSVHESDSEPLSTRSELDQANVLLLGVDAWANALRDPSIARSWQDALARARASYKSTAALARELVAGFQVLAPAGHVDRDAA